MNIELPKSLTWIGTSKKGIATPKADIELIKSRLKDAEQLHKNSKK